MEKTCSGMARKGRSKKAFWSKSKIEIIKTNDFTSMSKEEAEFKNFRQKYPHLDKALAKERFQQGWR